MQHLLFFTDMRLLHPDVVESSLGVAGSHCAMDLVTASDEFSQVCSEANLELSSCCSSGE